MMKASAAVAVSAVFAVVSTYLSAKAVVKSGFGFYYSVTTTMVSVSYTVLGVSLYILLDRFRNVRE